MRTISKRLSVLTGITALAIGALAGAPAHAADTSGARCKSGDARAALWSPKGGRINVGKMWKCDRHGGYDGVFIWTGREKAGPGSIRVWAQVLIKWESGRRTQKNITYKKRYVYRGAYRVSLRACDSTGCGRWW